MSKLDSLQDKWIKDDEVPEDKATAKNKIEFGNDLGDKNYLKYFNYPSFDYLKSCFERYRHGILRI